MQRWPVKPLIKWPLSDVAMCFKRLTAWHMGVKLGYDYCHPEWMGVLEMTTVQCLVERSEERQRARREAAASPFVASKHNAQHGSTQWYTVPTHTHARLDTFIDIEVIFFRCHKKMSGTSTLMSIIYSFLWGSIWGDLSTLESNQK